VDIDKSGMTNMVAHVNEDLARIFSWSLEKFLWSSFRLDLYGGESNRC
jgi:hypothetical protein